MLYAERIYTDDIVGGSRVCIRREVQDEHGKRGGPYMRLHGYGFALFLFH